MRRSTRFARISLLTVFTLTMFAAVAGAQASVPPTLSGESFHQDNPTVTSVTCSPFQPPYQIGGMFEARGTATGPYPGTFRETGEASVTDDQTGHATDYELTASFSIHSPVGRVTGTQHSKQYELRDKLWQPRRLRFHHRLWRVFLHR